MPQSPQRTPNQAPRPEPVGHGEGRQPTRHSQANQAQANRRLGPIKQDKEDQMKQIKLLGLALMAILALTGIISATSATAEELPNILPAGTAAEPVLATSSSGVSTFGNGILKLTSQKSKGTLDSTSTKLGTFKVAFEETEDEIARTCTGVGDAAGVVLVEGTFHIRDFKEKGTLLTAAIFLLNEVHFTCENAVSKVLLLVRGCVAGALTPENTLTNTLTVTLAKNGGLNDNLIITVLNEANTAEEPCQLLSSENEGAFVLSNEKTTQTLTGFKKDPAGTAVEVLVMRL